MTTNTKFKIGILFLFIIVYPFVSFSGIENIDPDYDTSGYNYILNFILLLLYPMFIGSLIYFFFVFPKNKPFSLESHIKAILFSFIWLLFSYILSTIILGFLNEPMKKLFYETSWRDYLFDESIWRSEPFLSGWIFYVLFLLFLIVSIGLICQIDKVKYLLED